MAEPRRRSRSRSLASLLDRARQQAALECLRPLPLPWVLGYLDGWSGLAFRIGHTRRRKTLAWLDRVVDPDISAAERERIARRMFTNAAYRRYLDQLVMRHGPSALEGRLEIDGFERVERARAGGRGVVLLTSHVGLPRLLRWALRQAPWHVCHVLRVNRFPASDRRLAARFERWHRRRYGLDDDHLIGSDGSAVQCLKHAYDHLRRNGVVNIAGDGGHGALHVPVRIAGREYRFATGGVSLGRLAGAPILPAFTWVDAGPRFHVEVQEPLPPPPRGTDRDSELDWLVQSYAGRLDDYVRRHPSSVVGRPYCPALH